jgi:prepilin-type N-terminal cleavage/methylation domain-containing protein
MGRPCRHVRGEAGFTLVELLVTIVILGIITSGITSVVISSLRVEHFQQQLQDVVDDGRTSMARIRKELRGARRVHEGSAPDRLHFWVDQNQNALMEPAEQICYVVEEVVPGVPGRYQISRWAGAVKASDCAPGALPSGQARSVVARTLVDRGPFSYVPCVVRPSETACRPGSIKDRPTREVLVDLRLEVEAPRGPGTTTVEGSIRLRNVP